MNGKKALKSSVFFFIFLNICYNIPMTRSTLKKLSFILLAVVLSSTLYLSTTYATLAPLTPPPSGGYDAGSNSILDPGCGPTDTDCFVKEFEGWKLTGNAGTTAGTNFIGTTDAVDFVIKANGVEMGRFYENTGASQYSVALGGGVAPAAGMFTFGTLAGNGATDAFSSNFIGYSAGQFATDAYYSNFFGIESGNGATFANNSNFFGQSAGEGAINANQSNFIGWAAGGGATNADNSNFFGYQSGNGAVDAAYANFFGFNAGLNADEANDSNFLGNEAGSGANSSYNSNFFGTQAGYAASNAQYSNFLGQAAGKNALFAQNSNFMGRFAGQDALSAQNSNFFGQSAGEGAIGASYSNFFGPSAGVTATNAQYSNFFGANAGYGATQAQNSNFFGQNTGASAVTAANSIFIGVSAGNGDLVNNTTDPDDYSILIGNYASTGDDGFGVGFSNSIALGAYATNTGSNQLQIGSTTRPISSVFIGDNKGSASTTDTFFVGTGAGLNATNASGATFIGSFAGANATEAIQANFFGSAAGVSATNAIGSIFIGSNAGRRDVTNGTENASRSIFIGLNAGYTAADSGLDNTSSVNDFSILIGNNTSTGGFENSIAIGGSATNTASNQFMIGSATRPIDTTRINGSASTQCTITTGTGIACTSDERVKTNITDLTTDTLDKLLNVKTVTYNWLQNPTSKTQIGFLAQDLEQYFPELVDTDSTGMKSVYYAQMTPILVEAIRELNLKITDINNTSVSNTWRDALIAWFGNIENGITDIYAKVFHADRIETKELCIDDVCITKDQLQTILNSNQIAPSPSPAPVPTIGDDSAPSGNDDQIPPADNPSDGGTDTGSFDPIVTPPADTPAPADTSTSTE